ncbi:hypothetical protein B0H17DRAFT_1163502 [Mycena rosella]|uniref:Uncharacterized protein n=1 Tax=Mycena rosella TaxID=1033263 RepID=A0AAD7G4L8_MYCRO|nr:hypothetical protein B0H17DRAFT_1163502 [Mycena rosella]
MPRDLVKRACAHCGETFASQGLKRHEKACQEEKHRVAHSAHLNEAVLERENIPPLSPEPSVPQLGDIKREFHPSSGRKPIEQSLYEYCLSQMPPDRRPPTDNEPWAPFRSRLDFEVSEFAEDAMLNRSQIDTLIQLIRRCAANIDDFSFQKPADMEKSWDLASDKCTEFQKFDVHVPYKNENQLFEMYARPLWQWTLDLVQDPHLANFFIWDAEKVYRHDGNKYIRFYTEPWTANTLWDIQGPDNKACAYILYADKAKLSSFGTQKGYPIVARLANMVVSVRNSSRWGGGQIVGWLPVIVEDQAESGKPGYANFKNAVWHKSFYKLLESIEMASKTGEWVTCGDSILRCLFPMILILACDFEEACTMALTRGLQSLYPCPICYIKKEDQADVNALPALRTTELSQRAVKAARKLNADGREVLLKDHGLRNVDFFSYCFISRISRTCFWSIAYSDPYHALSFEHLHSYSSGLWGTHLFSRVKLHVERLGRTAALVDEQFDLFPRWRNLNHFSTVMGTAFNDGTKHEDISKQILFTTHNFLTDDVDLALLKVIRSYQELSLLVTLKKHTPETIASIAYIEAYTNTELDDGKNWNFPKMHAHTHAFDDIERKGIDEAMHGSTRNAYLRQTNFKNVAPQILKSEHRRLVGKYIRDQLDDLDQNFQREWDGEEPEKETPTDIQVFENVAIGAAMLTFPSIIWNKRKQMTRIHKIRLRLAEFLSDSLPLYGYKLPVEGASNFYQRIKYHHKFLKVFYQSLEDWADEADYLRCNPSFHGRPRYDGALVKTPAGEIFVKLIYMFKIELDNKNTYPLALVQPLDVLTGRISAKDRALKFIRVRERPRQAAEFIFVRTIIRGAVLVAAGDEDSDHLVMDVVDGDMYLRLKGLVPR